MKFVQTVASVFCCLFILLSPCFAAAQQWIQANVPQTNWISVACSADGSNIIVAAGTRYVYTSGDAGLTWTPAATHEKYWGYVVCSADGMKVAAQTFSSSSLYLSTNAGATWMLNPLPRSGQSAVAMSADGTKLVVAGDGGVLLSSDFGETWRDSEWLPNSSVNVVACSADAIKMVAEAPKGHFRPSMFPPIQE
jgi:photosystem II stability/assembly factor-like uncharacterized protein